MKNTTEVPGEDRAKPAVGAGRARKKPKLRGIPDLVGVLLAIPATFFLARHATDSNARTAAIVYGVSLITLLGVSAIYHIPTWSPLARQRMRRLDHSAIFLLIAGTYTPFCVLVLDTGPNALLLWLIWGGALAGVIMSIFWADPPRLMLALMCIALGWIIVPFGWDILIQIQPAHAALLLAGGALYTVGALVYARKWPDPFPRVFGHHEIFHVFVVIAGAFHYAVVWDVVA